MKTNYFLLLALVFSLMTTACEKESLSSPELKIESSGEAGFRTAASQETADIFNVVEGTIDGEATLLRTNKKVKMNFRVEGLTPGYAYTVWWVIWNKPENCASPCACVEPDFNIFDQVEVEVLYAAGHVVGASGKGHFSGNLNIGDDDGSINESIFGLPGVGGLQDARTAEVHLVLRSHGPAIPGEVDAQINSYPGGCDVNFPAFTEIPDAEGECGDYMAAVFPGQSCE